MSKKLSRRSFLRTLLGIPSAIAAPAVTASQAGNVALSSEQLEALDKIGPLEEQLAEGPATTGLLIYLHNELRHLYLAVNEAKSREHSDAILRYSVLDGYTLEMLGEWGVTDGDPEKAVAFLVDNSERYEYLGHLAAACLLKAGDICRDYSLGGEGQYYRRALNIAAAKQGTVPTLSPYYHLARARLGIV